MKRYLHNVLAAAMSAAVALSSASTAAFGAGYDDHDALQGAKEVKVAFDITAGGATALLWGLHIIDETRRALIEQGVAPPVILLLSRAGDERVQTENSKDKPEGRGNALENH